MGQVALTSPGKVTYWRRFIMSKRLTKGNSTLKQGSRVSGRHGGFLRRHGAENPGFGEDWRSLASILQLAASLVDRGNIVVFPCISTHFHSFPPVSSFRHGRHYWQQISPRSGCGGDVSRVHGFRVGEGHPRWQGGKCQGSVVLALEQGAKFPLKEDRNLSRSDVSAGGGKTALLQTIVRLAFTPQQERAVKAKPVRPVRPRPKPKPRWDVHYCVTQAGWVDAGV